nr:hypothetical protein [Candidatus Electrothrix aestuarii]
MDAAQVEHDCCEAMNENIDKMITDRVVFTKKPIQGKGKVGYWSIKSSCGLGVGVKGVGKCSWLEVRYVKRCVIKNVPGIIKMPTIMQNTTINKQSKRTKKS